MKSLQELEEIRKKALDQIDLRKKGSGTRVVVGMATCGIAAGARPVLTKFVEEVKLHNLKDVVVSQTGCIGACRLEPMVEIYRGDEEKVTYVKVTPEMVAKIITQHVVNGNPVIEYTIGYAEANKQ
jgi:NADP-reducing hydrogenase subunit HndB